VHAVGAGAPIEQIVRTDGALIRQDVVAITAIERVRVGAGSPALERVVAGAAGQRVTARPAEKCVVRCSCATVGQDIVAGPAIEQITVVAAVDIIVSVPGINRVGTRAGIDRIVAGVFGGSSTFGIVEVDIGQRERAAIVGEVELDPTDRAGNFEQYRPCSAGIGVVAAADAFEFVIARDCIGVRSGDLGPDGRRECDRIALRVIGANLQQLSLIFEIVDAELDVLDAFREFDRQ